MQVDISYAIPVLLIIITFIGFVLWIKVNNETKTTNDESEYNLGLQHSIRGLSTNKGMSEAYMDGYSDGQKQKPSTRE